MSQAQPVRRFATASGIPIFQIPIRAFPELQVYAYLVPLGERLVLIDAGSGFGAANGDLVAGVRAAGELLGRPLDIEAVSDILLTHAHIDHFGGLVMLRQRTSARLGVHELDQRILTNYEERLTVIARRLEHFLIEAGVSAERCDKLLALYRFNKSLFHSVTVDFTYTAEGMRFGPFEMCHVPGHSPGHVLIRLEDVVFSGDHVLNEISPHQAPEHLTLSTGLDHYLHSLEAACRWAAEASLILPGHKTPVRDLCGRAQEIRRLHEARLGEILDYLNEPLTITQLSQRLFKRVSGYNVLLALEETGAHVEYLYQRGWLGIANLAEVAASRGPVGIFYRRIAQPEGGIGITFHLGENQDRVRSN
jgi:glyoxylase-like metal-dependent hydrolase (beta-lactamase superfamily II)